MYFVNNSTTRSSSSEENNGREHDVQIADRPSATTAAPSACSVHSCSSSCQAAAATTSTTTIAESDVPGLTLQQLRADGLLWAVYERGWKDAYSAALAAFAVHLPSPSAAVPTPPPPPPSPSSPPSPPTDSRPTSGPVRHRARAHRQARRKKVPSRRTTQSSSERSSSDTSTTAETLQHEEEEIYKKNCYEWVNSIELNEQCGPEDVICPGSDVGSCSTIPQTPEEIDDAMWQPPQNPCFQNYTTAETAAYKTAWFHIPSAKCCEHCVLKRLT